VGNSGGVWHRNLREVDAPEPKAGAGEIVVAMKAASLNYRERITGKLACFALVRQ
jgi:NADPH:quinone reductase-like Zn-dependent oxidoreductase